MSDYLGWVILIVGVAIFIALALINHTLEQIRNHLAHLSAISDNTYRATRKYEGKDS